MCFVFPVSVPYASAMSHLSASVALLFITPLLSSFVISAGFTDSGDVSTMLSLKNQLGNTPSTWKGGDPCGSKWDGVTCIGSRITYLTLSSVNLKGQLPGEIGRLSELQILDLSYNPGLTGTIPSELGNLQRLQTLILIGCRFSGRIPEELGKLHKLVFLDMNSNDLSGSIPPSLSNLTKLYWFDLSNNSISGEFPVELKRLVKCGHFHFNKNKLSGSIPPEVFHKNMTLKHILFDNNSFTGNIPSTFGSVSTLTVLRLDGNSLEGPIPSNIAHLELNDLRLSNNNLSGSIPDLSRMDSLQYLDLSNNSFEVSDLPSWLSDLTSLTTIVIENCNLNGQLPAELFSLQQLETVILSNNSIDGALLIMEGSVSQQLQLIDLRYNNITDIPLGKSFTKTWALEGNPVCESQPLISNSQMCLSNEGLTQATSYKTDMAHCGNDITCTGDLEKVNPQNCQCATPYMGTMVLRSPSFSTLTNTDRFQRLENSLCTGLNLTKGSVYLCCMWFDGNGYLNIPLQIFPPPGRKSFDLTEIINLSSALSNQSYQPPAEFGPCYFIPSFYNYLAGRSKSLSTGAISGIAVGAAVLIIAIIAIGIYALWQRRKAAKAVELSNPFASWGATSGGDSGDAPKLKGARVFSFQELKTATNNFSRNNEIGSGGFGKVYKGILPGGGQMVAVKRARKESNQGVAEFKTELEMLSRVHHKNLLGLIGFCFEPGSEQMLVYEYMPNGSLRDSLSGKTGIRLNWWKRFCIALGSARGLAYLHEHADPPVIHRDVKSTNILLDENMVAKVADFGLSKLYEDTGLAGHVSTQVKGTMGYLDPEYYMTQQLTQKSDVYSFGVVLLEILASRQPLVERGKYLVQEVKTAMDRGGINAIQCQILDPFLREAPISPEAFESFVSLSLRCVEDLAVNRPKMRDVVTELELIVESVGGPHDATAKTEHEYPTASPQRGQHLYNYRNAAVTSSPSFEYSGGFAVDPSIEPK